MKRLRINIIIALTALLTLAAPEAAGKKREVNFDALLRETRSQAAQSSAETSAALGDIAVSMRATQAAEAAETASQMSSIASEMRRMKTSAANNDGSFYSPDITYSTYGTDARADIATPAAEKYVNPYIMGDYTASTTFARPGLRNYLNRDYGAPQQSPVPGRLTSGYGYRPSFGRMHRGVDLSLRVGDTVRAAFAGRVVLISNDPDGYGRYVKLKHDNGLETLYAHLSRPIVVSGQHISAGQPLGLGGATGNATGPHLHFETRINGNAVDPTNYFNFGRAGGKAAKTPSTPLNDNGHKQKKDAAKQPPKNERLRNRSHLRTETVTTASTSKSSGTLPRSGIYRVRRGESLEKIAREHGMSVGELCRLNKMSKFTPMYTGKILRLK